MDIRSTESVKNHSIAPTVSGHSSDNIYCDMWARIRIPFLSSSLSYCSIHAWHRWQRRRMKCVVDTRVISCIFNMRMPPFFHFWSMASSLSANSELFRRKKKSHVCGATLYFSFCRRQSFLLLCLSFFFFFFCARECSCRLPLFLRACPQCAKVQFSSHRWPHYDTKSWIKNRKHMCASAVLLCSMLIVFPFNNFFFTFYW